MVISPKFKPQGINSLLFRVTPLGYLETRGFAGWSFITRTRLAEIAKINDGQVSQENSKTWQYTFATKNDLIY